MLNNQQKIKYFKKYEEAVNVAKLIPNSLCVNQYQWSKEIKCAKVREFDKGYAVQFGDCGDYVTDEFLEGLTIMLNNQEFVNLEPKLFVYLSDYINEELTRGATIDKYTISDAFEAFIGGAAVEDTNEE